MLEKHSLSSNEKSDSQSRKTDNDRTQSIHQFTKKLLSGQSQPHEQGSTSRASESEGQRTETEKARDLLRGNIKSAEDLIRNLGDKLNEKTKERYGKLFSLLEKRADWDPCEMHKQLADDSQALLETLKIKDLKAIQDLVKDPVPDNPVKCPSERLYAKDPFQLLDQFYTRSVFESSHTASDQQKTLKFEPSDKLLDIARGAVSKEWVHPNDAVDYLVKDIKKALQEGKKIGLMFDIDYTLLDPRGVKSESVFGSDEIGVLASEHKSTTDSNTSKTSAQSSDSAVEESHGNAVHCKKSHHDANQTRSDSNDWKIPQEWLEAVKKLQQHGIKIAINTGRNTKEIDRAFENAGAMELGNSLYLFGEFSTVYKKLGEDSKLTDPELEKYGEPAEKLREEIKNKIENDSILNDLIKQGIIPKIAVTDKKLGIKLLGGLKRMD